jgi:hypothetical protein
VPDVPGGGTVAYVNNTEHDYLTDVEHREEGGTPDIVGSIRAGLVFQLKHAVGVDEIARREHRFVREAIAAWEAHPNLMILGSHAAERLSIVSFVVRDGEPDRYLHHNFVVAVLNDLFGIQSRGGCSCAGPYGHRLLGIDLDRSHEFEREITRGCEGIKPGWVRVNFNYFIDDETFRYIVDAVALIADRGPGAAPLLPLRAGVGPLAPPRRCRPCAVLAPRHRLLDRHHGLRPSAQAARRRRARRPARRGPAASSTTPVRTRPNRWRRRHHRRLRDPALVPLPGNDRPASVSG